MEAADGGAEGLALWKRRVREAWEGVKVDHVESLDGDQLEVGAKLHVSALVRLGELTPNDIEVQLVTGRLDSDDQLRDPRVNPFPTGTDVGDGLRRYEGWVEAKRSGRDRLHRPRRAAPPAAGQPGRDGPGHPARRPAHPALGRAGLTSALRRAQGAGVEPRAPNGL